ncbi:MAG: hypothetical protein EOR34_10485 [Mesorhizobium sp.]|uniref:hypothetical protein n=1 Tax=Mesorhizobium sp. TaxID=1871066 RepID=UPI000FE8E544|nr:hypothetical protein [Mesorhizobium sp.]RWH49627.1 MAG: hypothetical protein EOQ80_06885 [Mesorhizobium sp.]RWI48433.1 MAG: hypothetical protein EOR15_13805 [Mesorhizobium sp.]RWI88184.1 MAG: hypothetical protein EOR20_03860 [Mesorhizobium sp.]RWJ60058.1 MAG: hypothetical protein EOR32_19405 [Mesorhizobium sp.]RWJ74308.1 MAG: hypothetical protein EOR34_10485 [Mesorhizobium sp.]
MDTAEIKTEVYREYVYPDGAIYHIDNPVQLWWKRDEKGDSHRVLDIAGVTHYPIRGWLAIRWKAPDEPVSF